MSQEKWNDLQREQRKAEFAPIPEKAISTSFSSQTRRQPFVSTPIINEHVDIDEINYDIDPPGTNDMMNSTDYHDLLPSNEFQSRSSSNVAKQKTLLTGQRTKKPFVRRHIENKVSSDEDDNRSENRHPEFAPPATFEYYGPTTSGNKRPTIKPQQLESSIEAGLKFLREQSDKDTVSTKMKWASNAGY